MQVRSKRSKITTTNEEILIHTSIIQKYVLLKRIPLRKTLTVTSEVAGKDTYKSKKPHYINLFKYHIPIKVYTHIKFPRKLKSNCDHLYIQPFQPEGRRVEKIKMTKRNYNNYENVFDQFYSDRSWKDPSANMCPSFSNDWKWMSSQSCFLFQKVNQIKNVENENDPFL